MAADRTRRSPGSATRYPEAGAATTRHACPGVSVAEAAALARVLRRNDWVMRALGVVDRSGQPDAWVGAGVIRDAVWGDRHGRFDAAEVRDIDVAYFDPADLTRERDEAAQQALQILAALPWEATNQAAVHTWYHEYFGGPPVEPFRCVHDAVATWPETATCVAVRLVGGTGDIDICAPHGLADLLGCVWRVNPVRVTAEISKARLARQRVRTRWPLVTVLAPGQAGPFPS